MGRKPWLPAKDKRKESFRVCCTKRFKDALMERAAQEDKTLSDYVRDVLEEKLQERSGEN